MRNKLMWAVGIVAALSPWGLLVLLMLNQR
jgi:hypothetical protein